MIQPDELVKGRYYEAIYVYENETTAIYVGVATSETMVNGKWKNGRPTTSIGTVRDANSVREVSRRYYETGKDVAPENNKAASMFLEKE